MDTLLLNSTGIFSEVEREPDMAGDGTRIPCEDSLVFYLKMILSLTFFNALCIETRKRQTVV